MRRVAIVPASSMVVAVLALMGVPGQTETAGPFLYHTLTPCRLADTRNAGSNGGPALADNTIRNFKVQDQGSCGVPVGAKAVSVNVTAVAPNGQGFLTLYPAGTTRPVVSNLNFPAGLAVALGNGAIVSLADQTAEPLDLAVYARVATTNGTVHMVLDVTGYFVSP